jgi:hypothetical protein
MTRLEELKAAAWMAYDALDDECADDPHEVLCTWIDAWEDCCDELEKTQEENSND